MKCTRCSVNLKEGSYVRRFRGRYLCKNCYPKFLKHIVHLDNEKMRERTKLKDEEFIRLMHAAFRNLKLIYGLYKKDFDQKLADILISRKDDDGYFFERIAIYLESDVYSDMIFDIRSILSLEYSLLSIRQNLNSRGFSEYKQEIKNQINGELLVMFDLVIKLFNNVTTLYEGYSRTFADETFALRDYVLKKMDEYIRDISPANIAMVLRKITFHLYELLFFIDTLYG